MKLHDLLKDIDIESVQGSMDVEVSGIEFDSRKIRSGEVFVAQTGTAVDGHTFIDQCVAQGAKAIVCQVMPEHLSEDCTYIQVKDTNQALGLMASNFYGRPSEQLTLVGVTGTNGKTTIATLLYKLVRALGHKAGLLSTVVNYIEDEAIPSTHTTPDALALNGLMRQMVDSGCEYCFMEVSSHSIAQERIAGLDFDGAMFTNLTRDHIDYHKTFDNYRASYRMIVGL